MLTDDILLRFERFLREYGVSEVLINSLVLGNARKGSLPSVLSLRNSLNKIGSGIRSTQDLDFIIIQYQRYFPNYMYRKKKQKWRVTV